MRSSMLSVATLLALGVAVPAAAQQAKPVAKTHRAMTVSAKTHHLQAPADSTKHKAKRHRSKAMKPATTPAATPAPAPTAPSAAAPAAKPAKGKSMTHKRAKPDSTKKPSQR
jgi:hypothetical protein